MWWREWLPGERGSMKKMSSSNIPGLLASPLSLLTPSQCHSLQSISQALLQSFDSRGISAGVEYLEEWVCFTIEWNDNLLSFGVMLPEEEAAPSLGLLFRVGVDLSFGLPSGEVLNDLPGIFFYPPTDFTLQQLLDLCLGEASPAEFTELLNNSNFLVLSSPQKKFPKSILVMVSTRSSVRDAGERCFELWTQSGGRVRRHSLTPTNNPHQAAIQAHDMGFWPTIYRCTSGVFVAFKTTDGGVFI